MKTRKRKKPNTYWVWKSKDEEFNYKDLSETKKAALINTPLAYKINDWRTAYADGWRIVKVKVLEVKS